jgi:hypothetical protein
MEYFRNKATQTLAKIPQRLTFLLAFAQNVLRQICWAHLNTLNDSTITKLAIYLPLCD